MQGMAEALYTHPRNSTSKTHSFARRVSCEAAEDLAVPNFLIEQRGNREHVLYFLDEILVGFLGRKCRHGRVSRRNTAPTEFLAEFCQETRPCVRDLRPINTNKSHDTGEGKWLIGPNLEIFI